VPGPRRSRGFALLITLTLLAFVVLLLVGLASYTKIETAVAGNFQKQAQARQNAQLALDVALAQLQKHAGPDTRVTASAESFGGSSSTRHYAGVWDAIASGADPVSWLVSGNELNPLARTPTAPGTGTVELVGRQTTGAANAVLAPLVALTSVGVPGQAGATAATIGRYAWWIGDQGVKAPVGLRDTTDGVDYAPFDSAELRSRIRQQISLGAGPANFEPRDAVNALLVPNLKAANQLAFLRTPGGTAVGLATLQANFAAWSPNNFNVLADTAGTGLKRDLSIDPSLLGASAQAWLDYTTYMESPVDAAVSSYPPLPAFSDDPLRRRYKITAANPRIAPVLSSFFLTLGVRKNSGADPYTVSLRWGVTLWNPYAVALVPEDLKLEVSGLPSVLSVFFIDPVTGAEIDDVSASLSALYGDPLTSTLPWALPSSTVAGERSWLPGRVHNWVNGTGAAGVFDERQIPAFDNGAMIALAGNPTVNGSSLIGVRLPNPTSLVVKILNVSGDVLATYVSPTYDAVSATSPVLASSSPQQLVFPFRLVESFDFSSSPSDWLTSAGHDPRSSNLAPDWLRALPNGTNPSSYGNFSIVAPDRLIDRVPGSLTYNEDVPVFELPRAPVLSLGALQHLALPGARPFSIGNSWGATADINGTPAAQLFDRFFFSGLTSAMTPTATGSALVLPNPLLRVAPRLPNGTPTTAADLRAAPSARSSKFLLQGSSFNLNSTNPIAWAAVLRGVRFPAPAGFDFVNADPNTGTAESSDERSPTPLQSESAQFFRFSQSAQETYEAEPGIAAGTATPPSTANTHLFRKGVITLDAVKVTALANQITWRVQKKIRDAKFGGPFRSLEEFLSISTLYGGKSLLESAIAGDDATNVVPEVDLNASVAEFSSQFLTQGDIMTALAPVLFPRSDTFVIRTYGEAVNPATGATEGRAWAEATVQRTPEYFDPADDATVAPADLNAINQTYGRRFKVVSFRWLTRADL
jgi:hypothetical protein